MLLRSNANTLDFMKDVVIILSNISQEIELPAKEQALCLLRTSPRSFDNKRPAVRCALRAGYPLIPARGC